MADVNPIFKWRNLRGLSRAKVADRLNIHRNTLLNWETGKSDPPFPKLEELAELFDAPLDDFLTKKTASRDGKAAHLSTEDQLSISWINNPEIARLVVEWHELQKEVPPEVRDRQATVLSEMLRAMLAPNRSSSAPSGQGDDQ